MDKSKQVVLWIICVLLSSISFGMYDTQTGRFIQRDPLGVNPAGGKENPFAIHRQYTDGMNLYQYCKSNPVNNVDPWGLSEEEIRKKHIRIFKGDGCTKAVTIDGHGSEKEDGSIFYGTDEELYLFTLNDMPKPGKCCCVVNITFKICYSGKNKDGILDQVASLYKGYCPNSKIIVSGCNGDFLQLGGSTGPGICLSKWNRVTK